MSNQVLIYINGASSSGKTSLATCLQTRFKGVLHYYSMDCVLETLPATDLELIRRYSKNERLDWDRIWTSYFRSAVAMSESGLDLILDCPLYGLRADLFRKFILPRNPLSVLLDCSLEELNRREKARGDRWVGLAEYQASKVLASIRHDLTFDSSRDSPDTISQEILNRLRHRA